ncbi:MAG: hypothetical protein JNJ80_19465 [Gemmatimonadetes bacterium]|nr:hypothetical protein [Gemmatimonadota bacterium]
MRRLFLLVTLLAACATDGTEPGPEPSTRSYRMGFAGLPPRLDQNVAVQALEIWTRRADIAIVHEELPWTALLAGTPPDTLLAREKDGLIQYYRAKGLALVFIADATDGLAREKEAPQLRAAGRSLTEPAVQRLYRDWILAFVRRYRPEYVGLAAETNLIRFAAPRPVYNAVVQVVNAAAADLAALASPPRRFISVQVEVAWGKLVNTPYQGIETDLADFPFVELLGLSSYPYFGWPDPAQLPDDYYSRLLAGRSLPVMVVEGGWASGSSAGFTSSPARQAQYLARQARLLERTTALGWLQLTPTDLDLSSFPADVRDQLTPFATLGVLDANLAPKPALAVWDSLFSRRRQ